MRKLLVSLSLFGGALGYILAGCGNSVVGSTGGSDAGSGSGSGSPGADSGGGSTGEDSGNSGSENDGGASGSSLPDAGIPPNGTLLVPSPQASLAIVGVTTDDFVVYIDSSPTPPVVSAISLAPGSKPIALGPADPNLNVVVAGKVVLFESEGNTSGVGKMSAWTSTSTAPALLSTATCSSTPQSGLYAASADGKYVLFFDDSDPGCVTGTLTVAAVDGSMKTALVPTVDLAGDYCSYALAFGGDNAVAGYCVTSADAGVVFDASTPGGGTNINVATVTSFLAPSWTPVSLAVGAQPGLVVDPAGTKVVLVGAGGTVAYPIDGGAPVTIDPNGELGSVNNTPGLLADDGGTLIYTTINQALARAATTSPSNPTTLSDAGAYVDVLDLSPDQRWVIGTLYTGFAPIFDLYLASTSTVGATTALSSTPDAMIQGSAFTADSSRAIYLASVNAKQSSGTLTAAPVAGGAPAVTGTPAVLSASATSGTKLVISGNLYANYGVADILVADTATTSPPKLLVSLADQNPLLNAEKTVVVYTWSYRPGSSSGLWALTLP